MAGSDTPGSLLVLLLGVASCITDAGRGYPLYTAASPLGPDEVATLGGYVARVDGRDVSALGGAFELRPGCHVVQTPRNWGSGNQYGAVSATTGTVTFALPMVAGRHYLVVTDADTTVRPTGGVSVRADETTTSGDPLRSIAPAKTAQEIDACRHPLSVP
jgi:hypothetical protein